MYRLPSTSVSVQPRPDSKATGKSFTWLERPLKCFVHRSCRALDFGPGGGTRMHGYSFRSTCAQFVFVIAAVILFRPFPR